MRGDEILPLFKDDTAGCFDAGTTLPRPATEPSSPPVAALCLPLYRRGYKVEAAGVPRQPRERKPFMPSLRPRCPGSIRWLFLLALAATFCCSPSAFAATKVITDADQGGKIHLNLGDTLELRLKSNPSTGYMWYVEKESTPILKLGRQSQTQPDDPSMDPAVGRPVIQIFKLETRHRGQGVLLLHYVRSWDKPSPDDEQFKLHAVIE
jgi:inhibitor of cysteine peptidase